MAVLDPIYELADQTVTLTRGQTRGNTLSVYSDEAQTAVVDISSVEEITLTVRQNVNGPALIVLNTAAGITSVGGGAGNNEFTYTIPDTATHGWNGNTYFYDIKLEGVSVSGDTYFLVRNSKLIVQASPGTSANNKVLNDGYVNINEALITAGTTELDGDKVDIDYTPSSYTPDASAGEADDVDDLAAHLKGIDTALGAGGGGGGGGVTDHGALTGLADDDHPQYLLEDGSRALSGDLNLDGNGIVSESDASIGLRVGTPAGYDPLDLVNGVVVEPATFVNSVKIKSEGSATNISILLEGKGSGVVGISSDLDVNGNVTFTGSSRTVDGRDVSVDGTKLDTVETSADVTDATNVAAAGAVMDSDFSASDGYMLKTGSGTYAVTKANLAASTAPGVNDDNTAGYSTGSLWIDTTGAASYVCITAGTGAADWNQIDGGGGGSGDFVGPASSLDNAIVRYDSTTGKLGQDSLITVNDDGDLIMGINQDIFLDDDLDTKIWANVDDIIRFMVGGTDRLTMANTGNTFNTGCTFSAGLYVDDNFRMGVDSVRTTGFTASTSIGPAFQVDTTGGAFTLTLFTASFGYMVIITDVGGDCLTNNLTIAPASGDVIVGYTSLTLRADNAAIILFAVDSTNWIIIGGQGYTAS